MCRSQERKGKPRARGGKDPVASANGRCFPFFVVQRPTQWHTAAANPVAEYSGRLSGTPRFFATP